MGGLLVEAPGARLDARALIAAIGGTLFRARASGEGTSQSVSSAGGGALAGLEVTSVAGNDAGADIDGVATVAAGRELAGLEPAWATGEPADRDDAAGGEDFEVTAAFNWGVEGIALASPPTASGSVAPGAPAARGNANLLCRLGVPCAPAAFLAFMADTALDALAAAKEALAAASAFAAAACAFAEAASVSALSAVASASGFATPGSG